MNRICFRTVRPLAGLCVAALLTLGASACMGGRGMGMQHEMTAQHSTLAAMLMTANQAEIDEARLALSKSQNPAVRQFAERMIADHTAAMQKMEAMMMDMGMDRAMMMQMMTGNPTVQQMKSNHMQMMETLRAADGMAFDRTYIAHQAAMHRYLVQTMDSMMPGMHMAGEMQMMHENLRDTLASHQQMAEQIMGRM